MNLKKISTLLLLATTTFVLSSKAQDKAPPKPTEGSSVKPPKKVTVGASADAATEEAKKQAPKKVATSLVITEKQNGKTVTVKKGQKFTVLFKKECIGCRYVWQLEDGSDKAVVNNTGSSFANKSCTDCTGGNQDHIFSFTAGKAGKTTLKFGNGEKTFSVNVVVK